MYIRDNQRTISIMRNLLLIALVAFSFATFAQQPSLTGVWELKRSKDVQGTIIELPVGTYKLYTSDGRFSIMRLTQKGAILTHEGHFEIDANHGYVENVDNKLQGSNIGQKQNEITYKLSENGDVLTLEGLVNLGNGKSTFKLYEEWKKVKVEFPKE